MAKVFEYLGGIGSKLDSVGNKVSQVERKINSTLGGVWSFLSGEEYGSLNRSQLAQVLSRPDFLPAWNFDIELPTIESMGKKFSLASSYIEASNVPIYQFSTREIFAGGSVRKYLSHQMTLADLNLTLYADTNNNALGYIIAWLQNCYPGGGYWNLPYNAFKKNAGYMQNITLYGKDMYNQVCVKLEYKDCFPIAVTTTDFGSESQRVQYFMTFAVNDLYFSGYNMTTFSEQISNLFTDTINKAMGAASDAVIGPIKDKASLIGGSVWKKLKSENMISGNIANLF